MPWVTKYNFTPGINDTMSSLSKFHIGVLNHHICLSKPIPNAPQICCFGNISKSARATQPTFGAMILIPQIKVKFFINAREIYAWSRTNAMSIGSVIILTAQSPVPALLILNGNEFAATRCSSSVYSCHSFMLLNSVAEQMMRHRSLSSGIGTWPNISINATTLPALCLDIKITCNTQIPRPWIKSKQLVGMYSE